MPPQTEPLADMLPPRDPSFMQSLGAPLAEAPGQGAQPSRVQNWQAPQQTAPGQQAQQPAQQEAPVTREEFESLMDLMMAQPAAGAPVAPVATPAPAPVAAPAAAQPEFALKMPTIDIPVPTITPEEHARLSESPEEFAKYLHKVTLAAAQAGAAQTFAQVGPAVQAAATAAVRSEAASMRAVEQWFNDNPDLNDADPTAIQAAIRQAQAQYPGAPVRSQMFFATRLLRKAMQQNAAIETSRATARTAPGVPARQGRMTPGKPRLSPQATALAEMIEHNQGKTQLEKDLRL